MAEPTKTYNLIPEVDQVQEFIEISNDFSNPLDLAREAISNSYDAKATFCNIDFDVATEHGEKILVIKIKDDGSGMNHDTLKAFFDLGNSTRRGSVESIGEKGHGTKVYFNSASVTVDTTSGHARLRATMMDPYRQLHDRTIPTVKVEEMPESTFCSGTEVIIKGYNNNRRERFTHEVLKDYIQWFTKLATFEEEISDSGPRRMKCLLKGLNHKEPEELSFGHPFPSESEDINALFDKHVVNAPHHYCKRVVKSGQLRNHPEASWHAVFSIEGNRVKLDNNPMLRRKGVAPITGSYTVQERYGLWLCKDFIPVQRMNEWITTKGSEYTRLRAFINCQELRLTANRGSVNNTPMEYLKDLECVVKELFDTITNSDDWRDIEWLESQAEGYKSTEREKKDFEYRISRLNKSNVATFEGHQLVQPTHETGVFSLALKISTIRQDAFPFEIVDYNTHQGIDVIVKGDHTTPIHNSKLYYVEFKFFLGNQLNHSFENLHSIICWDTEIKHGDIVTDINQQSRRMHIVAAHDDGDYKTYFLDAPKKGLKIEVFVLKDYLSDRFSLTFRPRTNSELVNS